MMIVNNFFYVILIKKRRSYELKTFIIIIALYNSNIEQKM